MMLQKQNLPRKKDAGVICDPRIRRWHGGEGIYHAVMLIREGWQVEIK